MLGLGTRRAGSGGAALAASLATTTVDFTGGATGGVARTPVAKAGEVLSVKDFGAVGDGVTDDAAAFRKVRDRLALLGGGTAKVPAGTYLMSSTEATYFGVGYALDFLIGKDGVIFQGDGPASVVKCGANIRLVGINVSSMTTWAALTVHATTGSLTKGARTVTLTTGLGANYAADQWILVRTANCTATYSANSIQPDSEINRVKSVSGDVLTLYWPLCKGYVQEYFTADPASAPTACGPTTTTVTAWPAPFGVSNVNASMLHAPKFRNLRMTSAFDKTLIAGGQCYGFAIEDCSIDCIATIESMSFHRSTRIRRNNTVQRTASSSINPCYGFSTACGCVDTRFADNTMDSDGDCEMIHIHEGAAQTHVKNNTLNGTQTGAGNRTIAMLARGYDTIITGNIIKCLSGIATVYVDSTVLGGGIIANNHFWNEVFTTTLGVDGTGFTIRGNTIGVGKLSVVPGNTTDQSTESVYLPAGAFSVNVGTSTDTVIGNFANGRSLAPSVDTAMVAGVAIPDGWASVGLTFFIATLASGSGNVRWRTRMQDFAVSPIGIASLTTIFTADFSSAASASANVLAGINVSGTGTVSSTKRFVHVWIERQGTSAGVDTDTRTVYLLGAQLKRVS